MKFVFLDVDGVLNYDGCKEMIGEYIGIDDKLVDKLAEIVFSCSPPASIVLTSTWKECWDHQPINSEELDPMAKYLVEKLRKRGLRLTGRTEEKNPAQRGLGIQGWLRKVGNVDGWVVLDDEIFSDYEERGIIPHLVKTSFGIGLTDHGVEKAIKILRGE